MMTAQRVFHKRRFLSAALALLFLGVSAPVFASSPGDALQSPQFISTGDYITPTAATGSTFQSLNPNLSNNPNYTAGQAVTTAISPDGNTLLILTSGYNLENDSNGNTDPSQSNEYVFVYDISGPQPVQRQALQVPNTFNGIAWNPNGLAFYVSGGDDDNVHVFSNNGAGWVQTGTISLGHTQTNSLQNTVKPEAAGLAVSADGTHLIVANYENDSISLVDLTQGITLGDLDLRPGNGVPGGEYPFWVSIKGNNTAYVSSERDREIDVIDFSNPSALQVTGRIPVKGEPNKMIMNSAQTLLYIALINSDSVDVIDTGSNTVISQFKTLGPKELVSGNFNGINPNSLTLSQDEATLYVTNGGANSLAVIGLKKGVPANPDNAVMGLIPTGWYPNSVSVNPTTKTIYVVNGKSMTGPVPDACRNTTSIAPGSEDACNAANQYVWQLTKAGFQTIPAPNRGELERLTEQVMQNNNYEALHSAPSAKMAFLHRHIQHIIYIIKENRTYDQFLGDLGEGNGDPSLAIFPQAITPNQHELASQFVDLDNFYDSAQTSGDGWNWSTAARATDPIEKMEPVNYAGRGLSYDFEGTNRNINVGIADLADRLIANPLTPDDPNILPGTADVSAPDDSESDAGSGYLWNAVLKAGLSVRNYGFFIDLTRYSSSTGAYQIPPTLTDPAAAGVTVSYPTKAALQNITDPYFRGFDNNFPDFYRVNEWEREFAQYEANGRMPRLELVRLMHDHMGSFGTAIDGVNTPETQVADNDYAVGRIIQDIANSKRYGNNTLIFVVEDDSQDGPDHVDAHRSIAFVAGAFVNQGAVVSTRYTTVNMMRTIGEILGIQPLGINDATAEPMEDVFSMQPKPWTFKAAIPEILTTTTLPLPTPTTSKKQASSIEGIRFAAYSKPIHNASYWAQKTKGFDFADADKINSARFNQILWEGLKGKGVPYPTVRNGQDLSQNRQAFLREYYARLQVASTSNPN